MARDYEDSVCKCENVLADLSLLIDNRKRERTLARQHADLAPVATLLEWITEDIEALKRMRRTTRELYGHLITQSGRIEKVKVQ